MPNITNKLGPYTIMINELQRKWILYCISQNEGCWDQDDEVGSLELLETMFTELPEVEAQQEIDNPGVTLTHGFCL